MLGGFCSPVDCPVHTETTSKPSSNNPAAAVLALISAVLSLSAHRQAAHKDDNSQRKGCTILEIFGVEERGPNLTPALRRRYPLARTTPAFILAPRRLRMVSLSALWLPIVLSAVIVFVASSIMYMLLPYHRSDYRKLPEEDKLLAVFRVAGTAAFLAYGLGHLSNGIWKGQPWGMTLKEVIDGLIYGLLTAGTFGWLWPR